MGLCVLLRCGIHGAMCFIKVLYPWGYVSRTPALLKMGVGIPGSLSTMSTV